MERITISIEENLLKEIDALCRRRGYRSRSEVFRDMARAELAREAVGGEAEQDNDQPCYGSLTYLYDHGIRDLPGRLTDNHHAHHALSIATTHVHVNRDNCLEISILAGTAGDLRKFADSVISQRGVSYGRLHVFPAVATETHPHGHKHSTHGHTHDEGGHAVEPAPRAKGRPQR